MHAIAQSIVVALTSVLATTAMAITPVYVARYEDHGQGQRHLIEAISVDPGADADASEAAVSERSYPQYVSEHDAVSSAKIIELRSVDRNALQTRLDERHVEAFTEIALEASDEVVTLVDGGPSSNRIDLVFMGDGYTNSERAKFFDDIQRIVREMFDGDTYRSYLPVFNVHAVFRPSNESGIGTNNLPKDTAYGLYRDGNTLRAIYPTNARALRQSCAQAPGCDYPVVIANDPNYGGLGGEFAISTSSATSGTVVLRHELGHNFGKVGEEYDGGGYFGANNSRTVNGITWRHWATQTPTLAEPVVARFLAWPWHNLTNGTYTAPFTSDGNQTRAAINFSASGIDTDETLQITLDGQELPFRSPGYDDRAFHNLLFATGFTAGPHELKFTEQVNDGNNWLSSLTVHEFGAGYHFADTYIGAYPVFGQNGAVDGYRPNHEACLMRNMQSTHFCAVCQENNWIEFLDKVNLIDNVKSERSASGVTHVTLSTLKLDGLQIKWFKAGVEVPSLANVTTWTLPTNDIAGRWQVDVRFVTTEIRKDTRNVTVDRKTFYL